MPKIDNESTKRLLGVDQSMFTPPEYLFSPKPRRRKNGYERQISKVKKDFMRGII